MQCLPGLSSAGAFRRFRNDFSHFSNLVQALDLHCLEQQMLNVEQMYRFERLDGPAPITSTRNFRLCSIMFNLFRYEMYGIGHETRAGKGFMFADNTLTHLTSAVIRKDQSFCDDLTSRHRWSLKVARSLVSGSIRCSPTTKYGNAHSEASGRLQIRKE